jgi:hypothetical protein
VRRVGIMEEIGERSRQERSRQVSKAWRRS